MDLKKSSIRLKDCSKRRFIADTNESLSLQRRNRSADNDGKDKADLTLIRLRHQISMMVLCEECAVLYSVYANGDAIEPSLAGWRSHLEHEEGSRRNRCAQVHCGMPTKRG